MNTSLPSRDIVTKTTQHQFLRLSLIAAHITPQTHGELNPFNTKHIIIAFLSTRLTFYQQNNIQNNVPSTETCIY